MLSILPSEHTSSDRKTQHIGEPAMSKLERIKGSIPPVVTPIRDGEVDYDAYKGLV